MTLTLAIFGIFVLIVLSAGVGIALNRNLVHAVFLLFVVLFGVAGLYVFAGAEFLAVSQVIVYVGGILILLLFGVMLTHKVREIKPKTDIVNLGIGLAVSGLLFGAMIFAATNVHWHSMPWHRANVAGAAPPAADSLQAVGIDTITRFLLPFEVISVLLLIALVGAAYIARKAKAEPEAKEAAE